MHKSIFVSSTFQDFQRERDLLQTKVELRTNELLHHTQVSFLDLRWGIDTTGETNLEKVVSICIAEVLNSHPFYVIMLGDNYGSCVDSTVARSLYALNGLTYDGQEKSVTQIEVEATGLFDGNREFVLVLNRQTDRVPDPRAAALKQRVLEAADLENVYTYTAEERNGSVFPDDEDALVEFIAQRLHTFLKDQTNLTEPYSVSLAREHARQFYGRQALLENLQKAVQTHRDGPVFRIYAPPGAGLTALLSKLYLQLQENGAQAAFLAADSELPVSFSLVLIDAADQLGIHATSDGSFFAQLDPNAQYYFILDDLNEIESDPCFHKFLRKGLLPKNVLFILAVQDPQAAHFCLDYPTKEDALALFDGTLQDYRKELPQSFRTHFQNHIPEEMVCQPALLKQFISALCYLTEDDYRKLGSSGHFMEDLTNLFTHKLDQFPKNERQHIHSALLNAPESQLWLLGLMSITTGGVDANILLGTLRSGGIECDLLQLRTVKEHFRDSIHYSDGKLYRISRNSFRDAVRSCFTPEQIRWLRYLFVAYLGQNLALLTQPQFFQIVAYQYLVLEDYPLLARLLESNCVMSDHGNVNGLRFSLLCGDYGADAPSCHYRALVKENNPYCDRWLVKYAMVYLPELYLQNATELFGQMYETVSASGTDDAYAADLLSLQVHGLALQLRNAEAQEITAQQLRCGKLKMLTNGSMIQAYLSACLSYNSDSAASVLDFLLEDANISQSGIGELLCQLLRLTDRMDANALAYRPQLERLFALCEEFLTSQTYQDAASIAVFLLHLSDRLQIHLSQRSATEAIAAGTSRMDLSLSTHLTAVYWAYLQEEEDDAPVWQELVDLVRVTLEDDVPLSTVDLFFVSAYFRKVCYLSPDSIPPATAAGFARRLFHRFWNIRGGIYSMMQLVDMIYLGCIVCLYEGIDRALELIAPLLDDRRVKNKDLLMELEYFRQDAQELIDAVPGSAHALDQLEKAFQNRR